MALPPKFKAHRLTFDDPSSLSTTAFEPKHTIEIFLDYVCPFSASLFPPPSFPSHQLNH
ncbi:hypothetical protein QBC40DRAFT_286358 [Triangularia verruculosa]|uniref:Thioredoxin-like fold domain-containing protein n=1 Tax=Triangularia verruculosa TaxID=2587418 RepID=A0AAN7ATH2_9PEZI|nr:hypothetical protein QBC40DRAFT_286358 [Triangularia verruculosa]